MVTQSKLTLINGTMNEEGGILMYQATRSFEIGSCYPGVFCVPLLPFPDDDDDWDDFDQADDQDK